MPNFLQFPSGLPWPITLAILVPLALYALLFLVMPFNVFGLKGRMDSIEARLDEIQEEIRSLAIRLREPSQTPIDRTGRESPQLPPIGPSQSKDLDLPRLRPDPTPVRGASAGRPPRSEPRLDWPP